MNEWYNIIFMILYNVIIIIIIYFVFHHFYYLLSFIHWYNNVIFVPFNYQNHHQTNHYDFYYLIFLFFLPFVLCSLKQIKKNWNFFKKPLNQFVKEQMKICMFELLLNCISIQNSMRKMLKQIWRWLIWCWILYSRL